MPETLRNSMTVTMLIKVKGTKVFTCEDPSQICCHQSSLKKQEMLDEIKPGDEDKPLDYYDDAVSCSTLEREGYR